MQWESQVVEAEKATKLLTQTATTYKAIKTTISRIVVMFMYVLFRASIEAITIIGPLLIFDPLNFGNRV